jgi:anhydro-N-acetylmuramic acid kinase
MVMDALVERMTDGRESIDRDGRIAARGRVDQAWLDELQRHPYFARTPPKTTGREMFGGQYAAELWRAGAERGLSPQDIVTTATALTAETITTPLSQIRQLRELILGGGGAHNPTLVGMIAARLPGVDILRPEQFGIPAQAKEALAFAILAYSAYLQSPNNLPSVTGARHPVVMGKTSTFK